MRTQRPTYCLVLLLYCCRAAHPAAPARARARPALLTLASDHPIRKWALSLKPLLDEYRSATSANVTGWGCKSPPGRLSCQETPAARSALVYRKHEGVGIGNVIYQGVVRTLIAGLAEGKEVYFDSVVLVRYIYRGARSQSLFLTSESYHVTSLAAVTGSAKSFAALLFLPRCLPNTSLPPKHTSSNERLLAGRTYST